MAKKNKVSVSTEPKTYRLSANERREARLAEMSNQQAELKREAAERRAKRAEQAEGKSSVADVPDPHTTADSGATGPGQSNIR